jgi:beta-glucanase (GH16 family)
VTKLWKVVLGLAIVAAIAIWDVGLPGRHSGPNSAAAHPSASASPGLLPDPPPPAVAGVLHPKGRPEFVADFSGSSLDTSVWDTCYPYMNKSGCQNFGNSQFEGEWYIPSQDQVSGGMLHLIAQRQPVLGQLSNGAPEEYSCRSGMVTSYPGLKFQYGYLQIVAKLPTSDGLWPALWLAAANFQWPPETDIVEGWGPGPATQSKAFFTSSYLHWKTPTGEQFVGSSINPAQSAGGWHTFALSWTKTQLTWLIDGVVVWTVRQQLEPQQVYTAVNGVSQLTEGTVQIPQQKMYLIVNLADAISPTYPTVLPGQCDGSLDIRSVTLWPA